MYQVTTTLTQAIQEIMVPRGKIFLYIPIPRAQRDELFADIDNKAGLWAYAKSKVLFVEVETDSTGLPCNIIRQYIGEKTDKVAIDEKTGKPVPAMMLTPFRIVKDHTFFKCDNCGLPGQTRGYSSPNKIKNEYFFCLACTEGH